MARAPGPDLTPASIGDHAADSLRFIRHTMERSSTFTAVPGRGGIAMGLIGLLAAPVSAWQPTPERWLVVWLLAAGVGFAIGLESMRRKARQVGIPLGGAAGRRFALGLLAPLVAGAALTVGLWMQGVWALMPASWLLLYGTGVLTGGATSVAPLRVFGACLMALGVVALATPPSWGNVWLGAGFGVLQASFGLFIAERHGG